MRTGHVIVAIVVLSMITCVAATAEPTLSGFTGLLTIPTADTLSNGHFNLGINSGELENWEDFSYYTNFGLDEGMEVGALVFRSDRSSDGEQMNTASSAMSRYHVDETFLNLKRALTESEDGRPRIAAGVFDVTDEVDTTVYMVATWAQGRTVGQVEGRDVQLLNLHAGFASGMIEDFFVGADLRFGPDLTVMGEWVDDDINVGARFSPADNFTVGAGLLDVDDLAVNVSYSSGL
ncbi:MAG: hypothetical protein ACOC7J_01670 [Armatimonadota bacterium]